MTTRNIVPRSNGEGQIGRTDKKWDKFIGNSADITSQITAGAVKASGAITAGGKVYSEGSEVAKASALAAVASGSPKGTYATAAALTTAYPTGNSNIYVVSADGKWYYWSGTAWTAGGVYQAVIGTASVSLKNLKQQAWNYDVYYYPQGNVYADANEYPMITIDTANHTATFNSVVYFIALFGPQVSYRISAQTATIDTSLITNWSGPLFFFADVSSSAIKIYITDEASFYSSKDLDNCIYLGYTCYARNAVRPTVKFPVKIDDNPVFWEKNLHPMNLVKAMRDVIMYPKQVGDYIGGYNTDHFNPFLTINSDSTTTLSNNRYLMKTHHVSKDISMSEYVVDTSLVTGDINDGRALLVWLNDKDKKVIITDFTYIMNKLDDCYIIAMITDLSFWNRQDSWSLLDMQIGDYRIHGKTKQLCKGMLKKPETISILGDSISTFAGYVGSNAVYYNGNNCGVTSVNQTWWKRLIDSCDLILCKNNSYSGGGVSNFRSDTYNGTTLCENLKDANGNAPNNIIVYMGINDFNGDVAIGTYDEHNTTPTTNTTFSNAYAIMLKKITALYPLAKVYCCTLPVSDNNGAGDTEPEVNDAGVSLHDYNEVIRKIARVFCAEIIEFTSAGLNKSNMSTYMGDYSASTGRGLHPNAEGHRILFEKARRFFR